MEKTKMYQVYFYALTKYGHTRRSCVALVTGNRKSVRSWTRVAHMECCTWCILHVSGQVVPGIIGSDVRATVRLRVPLECY